MKTRITLFPFSGPIEANNRPSWKKLTSETYGVSDLKLMLNGLQPKKEPVIVYRNDLAKAELKVQFKPVNETL